MTTDTSTALATDLTTSVVDLRTAAADLVISTDRVVDALLDLRNLGRGVDLGLEFTIDELLACVPGAPVVSTEWWRSALAELADYASYLS